MKKIGCRTHKRSVKGRASTIAKARSIHGLPWSLPVASWTLILLLLLSSSFSHVHETGERVSGDPAVGAHEDYLESSKGKKAILGGVGSLVDRSSTQLTEDSSYDRPKTRSGSNSFPLSEAAGTGVVSDLIEQAQGIHSSFEGSLDALQYAEYGAGLLHKSGGADESPETCTVGNPGCMDCSELINPGGSAGLECVKSSSNMPCTNEFFSEEHGESLDGAWLAQCSCFELGVEPKTCNYDRSLRDVFLHSSSAVQKEPVEQQRSNTEHFVDGEINYEADLEKSTNPTDQTENVGGVELLTSTPSNDNSKLQPNDMIREEGELVIENNRVDIEESTMQAEGGVPDVAHESPMKTPSELHVHDDVENDRGKDISRPLTEVHRETSSDGEMLEESRVSVSPHVDLGVLQIDPDDVLIDELQGGMKAEEEWLSSMKPLTSGGMETQNQLEPVKLGRVGHVMSLDEYKRSILEKQKLGKVVNLSTLQTHKTRHSDESYNYAASSHGAKVLSSNREAKGPGHIINPDKDKYLRNPCSAEDKFVVLELSEETFVDTVVIANFEFHSANVKDFEVYGSPVYPTKEWILLGKFHAENVRHRQKFTIEDPKLVRYLMLKMLSHWGSEFFCTLSAVEVFGVDVIKNLLDDWIASEEGDNVARAQMTGPVVHQEESPSDSQHSSAAFSDAALTESPGAQSSTTSLIPPDSVGTVNKEKKVDTRDEDSRSGDAVPEVHHVTGGKPPGDSVLKILMQRVKALELNQSLFDNYLEDTNIKYKAMLSELDKDLALLSERLRNETTMSTILAIRLLDMEGKLKEEKAYLEYQLSMVVNNFTENMEFMRWQIQSMERREVTAIILALFSPILSALLHLLARCMPNRRMLSSQEHTLQAEGLAEKSISQMEDCSLQSVCKRSSSIVLYLACVLIVLVLSV